jgi:hypothetical protein
MHGCCLPRDAVCALLATGDALPQQQMPVPCRVKISDALQLLISDVCSRLDVDGLRGDLVVNRQVCLRHSAGCCQSEWQLDTWH